MNEKQINYITSILNTYAVKVYNGKGDITNIRWSLPMENELEKFNRLHIYCSLNDLKGNINLEIEFNQPLLTFIIDL